MGAGKLVAVTPQYIEVPALPVVIPLGLALFGLLLWRLSATRRFTIPRAAVAVALSVYAAGVVANTVFPIFVATAGGGEPVTPYIALIPFSDYEANDALMNIGVFVPLGMLIPLMLKRPTWGRVLTIVVAASLAIEVTQYAAQGLFGGGHITDINDFIFNVIGGALGYGILLLLARSSRLGRVIDQFRWRASEPVVGVPVTTT